MNNGTSTTPTQADLIYKDTFSIAQTPTRSGYKFDGWSDGSSTYDQDMIYEVGTSNITLTAQWSAISYTVTYDLGIGELDSVPTQANRTIGTTFTVTNSKPTKYAYTFLNWSDGTNTYSSNATYTMGAGNVTLTAVFTEDEVFSITYLANSGVGTVPTRDPQIAASTFVVASGSTLSRSGYTFAGWNDGTATYQPGATYTVVLANITLTAQWTAVPVSNVEVPRVVWSTYFNSNGADSGNTPDGVGVFENSNTSITLPGNIGSLTNPANKQPMVKNGFTFEGWSTTKTGTIPLPASFTPTGNSILYAIWKAVATEKPTPTPTPTPVVTPTPSPTPTPTPTPTATPTPTPTPTPKPTPTPTPSPSATTIPQPTTQMKKVGTVYMSSGSYFLNDATKLTLKAIALKINASGAKSILVYGHADNRGGVNNTVLSQNRAKAVANYLRPLLKVKKISIGFYSSNKPAKAGSSAAALAQNRRVEIYTK
jgi:uncharacterized repeat protein (TIGR02543 family)